MEKGDCALSPLICSQLFSSIPFKLKWSLRPGGDLSMPTEKKAKGSKRRPSYTCRVQSKKRLSGSLGWPWTGNWTVQKLWLWSQSIISGEFWESHVKQTWSCPLWGSDREDKRRQLLCIIPKFSHGNAAKILAQHAAITPMHGLSHIPWSNMQSKCAIVDHSLHTTWVPWWALACDILTS